MRVRVRRGAGMGKLGVTMAGGGVLMLLLALALPAHAAARQALAPTVVTVQFDDGNADQMLAVSVLDTYGMRATFYVNSGSNGDPTHLSWAQLQGLQAKAYDIGGHTIDHANLKHLKPPGAIHEVCDDRQAIISHLSGRHRVATVVSFAYPFGSFDAGTEQIVAGCGYTSGRGVSGVNDRRVFGETIPPLDAFATRTPPNVKSGTTVESVEGLVTAAQLNGGGWVQIVFHHICDRCDAYSMTLANFTTFVAWLSTSGATVETTAQVMATP